MQHKIPPFLSKEFGKLKTKEEKDELLKQYRMWKGSNITELFADYLNSELGNQMKESDKKIDFVSWFQKKEFNSYYKGIRTTIRRLLNQVGE